jgi:LDH2 family malate/lactate/ureidoglycolate dehydrogenase
MAGTIEVSREQLQALLSAAASKVVPREEAEYFAREVIETHLRKSPRTNPLKEALSDLEASLTSSKAPEEAVSVGAGSYIAYNFHGHGPLLFLKRIHDKIESRSASNGVTVVAFQNSRALHTLQAWVQGLARRGIVSIVVSNGGPAAVIPFNGTRGLFGTNPLAFGFPGEEGEIHCIDMASSEIPYFDAINAKENNTPLPQRSAVDSSGNFTTDASKALDYSLSESDPVANITPLGGGYKGFYLTYLLELLTSGLIGMPASPQMSADYVATEHGGIIIAFNPQAMGSADSVRESVRAIHQELSSQTPREGTTIPIPGAANNARLREAGETILLDSSLVTSLEELARS